jgi:hypothetical protein
VKTSLPVARCRRKLATLWFVGAGVLFFLVLVQTLLGRYGDRANEAWGWALPTIMPTLSLIIGVLVADALTKGPRASQNVNAFLFRLTFSLSAVYLLVVVLTIAFQPFASLSPLELMRQANLWLGPFQGLVSASLGVFYVKQRSPERSG